MVLGILRHVLLLLGLGAPFAVAERRFAAHRVSYRRVLARDIVAVVIVVLLGIPTTFVVTGVLMSFPAIAMLRAPALPVWASFPLAVVASDFGMYWTHRLVHTRPLWRVHRWHHSPRYLYWLAGGRTSFLQGVIYALPTLAFLVFSVPASLISVYIIFGIVLNHWMHCNIRLKSAWLEAVFVTPRIHHIHHSSDSRHYGRNFGSLFSFWDRMFGTFVDPDDVTAPLEFGIREGVPSPRLIIGI
jgi:sterol desaturase/sphingolipid hydroxylase (fatty acid hydroxylase superfamily)